MKRSLRESPCRSFPVFTYDSEKVDPFIMTMEYSAVGMSAILSQVKQVQEKLHACAGRKCTNPESAYSSIKSKLCTITYGICKLENILWFGQPGNHAVVSKLLLHWSLELAEFSYRVVHRAGSLNTNADVLSRAPFLD